MKARLFADFGISARGSRRGDITTQSIIARNTRARAAFWPRKDDCAGLKLPKNLHDADGEQQIEAFASRR